MSKAKDKMLQSLETKFGTMLEQLKADKVINMNMENANISDSEVRALGSILSQLKDLKIFSLKKNDITDRGVIFLIDALMESNVEILDLSSNKISLKSLQKLKEYKAYNSRIRSVMLRNNDIPLSMRRKLKLEFKKLGLVVKF